MKEVFKDVKNTKILKSGEKYRDFSKWSCCNGRPAQMKNIKIFRRGEKYENFSKYSCCNGRPAQM
jgi:hypothetical protein